eukprot:TRINITY_DN1802_c0_g1_i2.p1 TRINITY_DN1802_c0_g1~~TRINITY_DN1802_c0_g1_i2.p1  ORF type:complete len:444 (+),score=143.81 TRINITY_DN1802_c0_g1_i2:100-1332(+)
MSLVELLGASLLKGKKKIDTASLASHEVVGLYFSAHWCPPCRGFTPKLAETYKQVTGDGKKFEIVFISSDKDNASFEEYYGHMPWLALDFADRDRKAQLSKKFKVNGIPSLVLLKGDGSVLTTKGRNIVAADPEGTSFPWPAKSLWDILGDELENNQGQKFSLSNLRKENTIFALYFSAHWCPPCRGFTPKLVEVYKKLKEQGKNFEVIFVSGDQEEEGFRDYFSLMPWLAVPFSSQKVKDGLNEHFEVEGIPHLVIFGSDGKIINGDARSEVTEDTTGADFPWSPKPLNDLNGGTVAPVNEGPALILFSQDQEKAKAVLTPIATEFAVKRDQGTEELIFYTAGDNAIVERIRALSTLPLTSTTLFILDVLSGGSFVSSATSVDNEGVVRDFIQQWKDKKITMTPFQKRS